MISDKPQIDPELVDSMRFYTMLSIVMSEAGLSEKESQRGLKDFIKDVRDSNRYSEKVIQANINIAYQTLPTEFLQIYELPSVRDDIKIQERGYWKRSKK